MKKIYLCNISKTDKELFDGNLNEDYQLNYVSSISDIKNDDEIQSVFISFDKETKTSELVDFISKYSDKLIVIFKEKNFEALMLCYQYRVCGIFESPLKPHDFDLIKIKIEIDSENNENLPIQPMIELFSLPVEYQSSKRLFSALKHYFASFPFVTFFGIVDSGEENEIMGEINERVDLTKLPKLDEKKYLETEAILVDEEFTTIATPIHHSETETKWIVVDILKDKKSFVLNKLFYKYLRNVNRLRDNLDKFDNLRALAETDEVTGLFNQRKLSEDLEEAVKSHEEQHENFSIMFIDVDHFKNVNDDYGHIIGSKLLLDMGKALKLILRQTDHIYRYGGDEFVVIMPNVEIKIVHEIAGRVLKQLKAHDFEMDNGEVYNMSVSIGIAEYPTDASSAMEIIRFADEMMYKSKKSGRGRVFHVNEVANVNASAK